LSAVLEDDVPSKYYLSAKAAEGILRRARWRDTIIPEPLKTALETLAKTAPDEK